MRTLALLGAAVLLAVALSLWLGRGGGSDAVPGEAPPRIAAEAEPPAPPPRPPEAEPPPTPRPASLRGTGPDGAYSLDRDGRFLPSPAVLRRFDYFLSVAGEEPLETTRARIEADIRSQLGPQAAADALDLLDRYLAYREAARALHAAGLGERDLETRLQRVRELRRAHFGADTARLLFDEEERLARVALERARIAADPELDASERRRRLEGLEAELPEPLARARARARLPLELRREEEALRAAGAGADAIRHLRETRLGPETAERLAALDAARADWARRLAAYRRERDALLAERVEGDADADALEALRAAHFAPHERPRVRGLDRIDGVAEAPGS